MTDMFCDHTEAKELAEHKWQTSNLARCYLDLLKKYEASKKLEQKLTTVYMVTTGEMSDMSYEVVAIYAREESANDHKWDLNTLSSHARAEVEERSVYYDYLPTTQDGR